jgi:hypothetical protein
MQKEVENSNFIYFCVSEDDVSAVVVKQESDPPEPTIIQVLRVRARFYSICLFNTVFNIFSLFACSSLFLFANSLNKKITRKWSEYLCAIVYIVW